MPQDPQEEISTSLVKLEEKLPSSVTLQNLLWKTTAQFKSLMTETGVPAGVKPTSLARRFSADTLTYLRIVRIYSDDPEKIAKDLIVTKKIVGKNPSRASLNTVKTYAYFWIADFCEWFEVSSTSLLKPRIKKIEIVGASIDNLVKYARDIEGVLDLKQGIEDYKIDLQTELKNLNNQISEANDNKTNLDSEILEATEQKNNLKLEIDSISSTLEKNKSSIKNLEVEKKHLDNTYLETKNNTDQLTKQAENLNKNIADLTSQLQKLTEDRNLISDEYGPYVKEGNSQAKIYSALVTIPLMAIFFSIYQIYIGASNLLTADYNSATDILAAFILRIPFAAIFGLAIVYSWKLANSMIQKIFKIHGDRLTLAKLLVVARETVYSSAKNLNVTDQEKLQEQTALKIEVLKSHMAKELSEDFTYRPKHTLKVATPQPIQNAINDDTADQVAQQP